jgi:hypothetical protein
MGKEEGFVFTLRARSPTAKEKGATMEANLHSRGLTTKAMLLVGLSIMVAVVLAIIAMAAGSQTGKAANPERVFAAKEVITANGPLPVEGKYTSKGGKLIISVAGSGWSSTTDQLIGMKVFVNGNEQGTAQVWTNEADSHKAFVSVFPVVKTVSGGPVTVKLDELNAQTNTDHNDFYRVTVVELPRNR